MLRGHLKHLTLAALSKGDLTGYDLMKQLEERLGTKPSPGSIYPTLSELEKEGLIKVTEEGRKRVYSLTINGRSDLKRLSALHDELKKNMVEAIKLCGMLSGSQEPFHKHIINSIERGDIPFKGLNPELLEFRKNIALIAETDLSASDRKKVLSVLDSANTAFEAIINKPNKTSKRRN